MIRRWKATKWTTKADRRSVHISSVTINQHACNSVNSCQHQRIIQSSWSRSRKANTTTAAELFTTDKYHGSTRLYQSWLAETQRQIVAWQYMCCLYCELPPCGGLLNALVHILSEHTHSLLHLLGCKLL